MSGRWRRIAALRPWQSLQPCLFEIEIEFHLDTPQGPGIDPGLVVQAPPGSSQRIAAVSARQARCLHREVEKSSGTNKARRPAP